MHSHKNLVERYVALWNEIDPGERRAKIEALWTPDGAHLSSALEAHGYDELFARVERSNRKWVIEQGYVFRPTGEMQAHHDAVTFTWEMLPRDGGAVESAGQEVMLLAPDGRARAVYQFILQ